jgi:hypothetical protein
MNKALAIALMAAVLAAAAPAGAQSSPEDDMMEKQKRAGELAREATEMLMRAIELMIQAIPQYGMPEIDEDGNIIIPRLPRKTPAPEEEDSPPGKDPGTEGDEGDVTETVL